MTFFKRNVPHYRPELIKRKRILPSSGQLLVNVGEGVNPDQIVARCSVPGSLYLIDLCRELKADASTAMRALCVREGNSIQQGQPIAQKRWLFFKQTVKAPCDGTIISIRDSYVALRAPSREFSLRAWIAGQVVQRHDDRGVTIECVGIAVQGAWGCGGESWGPLIILSEAGEALAPQSIDAIHKGAIIVGGTLQDEAAFEQARANGVQGIVVGSVHPNLLDACQFSSLPIVVTEGIGRIPMMPALYTLLQSHQGNQASISGASTNTSPGPELVIPLPGQEAPLALVKAEPIRVGSLVRLTRPPFVGAFGTIELIPLTPQKLPNGILADGAIVRLHDGRRVFVPFANMVSFGEGR